MNHNENVLFQNLQESRMSFDIVFERIIRFMYINRNGNYRLMIGTDSQVHSKNTIFITGIVILKKYKEKELGHVSGKWSFHGG